MDNFEYDAPAEVYSSDGSTACKRPVTCRRFTRSAEAIRFTIEQLPHAMQRSTVMEVGGDRIKFTDIRALYDSERYPLSRRHREQIDACSSPAGLRISKGSALKLRRRVRQERITPMLNFPNASRSYDATRRCVHFWGNDGAIEISFFLDEKALIALANEPPSSEASLLESFDQNRERILRAARKVYERPRKGSYDLFASDFR
jgi:hypothetical protein